MDEFDKNEFERQLKSSRSIKNNEWSDGQITDAKNCIADGKGRERKPFLGVAAGFRERTLTTTKLSAKLGVTMARRVVKSKVGSLIGGTQFVLDLEKAMGVADAALGVDNSDPAEQEKAVAEASEKAWALFGEMDQLKGLVMKFGQMASYLNSHVPPEAQKILAKLQSEASALPYEQIQKIVEAELGGAIGDLFDGFSTEAIAAASIGQVHKAVFKGEQVAVKIQYPGVEAAIAKDLDLLGNIKPFAALYKRLLGASINAEELLDELVDRVTEECDYKLEATNQGAAWRLWQHDNNIMIPRVLHEVSTSKVLVSEFVNGQSFYEFKESASQLEKDRAGQTLYRMSFESIFRYCFFNADPHPGNYLFRDDGQVAFLDYGCVVKFEQEFVQHWKLMAQAGLEQNKEKFKRHTREIGFVGNEKKFDWDFHWHFYQYALLPVSQRKPFRFTKAYAGYGDELLIFNNKNTKSLRMPKQLLFANRLQWGLKNILMDLGSSIDMYDDFRELIYGEEVVVFQ